MTEENKRHFFKIHVFGYGETEINSNKVRDHCHLTRKDTEVQHITR